MARIPDDELERVKRETDLVALVQTAGVALRPPPKVAPPSCNSARTHAMRDDALQQKTNCNCNCC